MKTILALLATPLAIAAAPALANDCTATGANQSVASNEAVVRDMLAYAYAQGAQQADCLTADTVKIGATQEVTCVDCPDSPVTARAA